ncbi:hypothetical protein K3495_g260 [Podosphaera aphanis]|nr:hypothetical protein K3495_g260 [Podosphaera aphanis]
MSRILNQDTPVGLIDSVAQAGRRQISNMQMAAQKGDEKPAGLGNWDNSCYQNSVLQGLASLKTLSDYLSHSNCEKHWPVKDTETQPDLSMSEALRSLIEKLNDPLNNGKRIWTPATLKNMSSWQQQDAQEYFSKVLDEIDKEITTAASLTKIPPVFGFKNLRPKDLEPLSLNKIRNPLEGLIAQRVGCTRCGHSEGLSLIPFNCLTVPLGRYKEYSISQSLDEYTKLELIEGVECRKCTLLKSHSLLSTLKESMIAASGDYARQQIEERLAAMTQALENDDYEDKTLLKKCKITSKNWITSTKSRQAVIARPPKSLIIHFNRSLYDEVSGELRKNCCQVKFSWLLDIGPWCLGSTASTDDITTEEWGLNPDQSLIASSLRQSRQSGPSYELRAVVTHHGRHENGHYVCYKKHPIAGVEAENKQGQWWRLSDDEVLKVTEENVLGQGGAFMLFYDCVQPAGPILSGTSSKFPAQTNDESASITPLWSPEPCSIDSRLGSSNQNLHEDLSRAVNIPLPRIEDDDLMEDERLRSILSRRSMETTRIRPDSTEIVLRDQYEGNPNTSLEIPQFPWKADETERQGAQMRKRNIVSAGSLVSV